jgi:hypothetical protein
LPRGEKDLDMLPTVIVNYNTIREGISAGDVIHQRSTSLMWRKRSDFKEDENEDPKIYDEFEILAIHSCAVGKHGGIRTV